MNKKRTLVMLLAGAMLLPANAFAASPEDFTDFPTDWSAAGLRSAVQNGLLNGSNGQINSSGLLIRAQMAAIVTCALPLAKQLICRFTAMQTLLHGITTISNWPLPCAHFRVQTAN